MRYLIPVLILLAGCATPEQRAEQRREKVQEIVAEYGPACEDLGHTPGTKNYADCVIALYTAEQQRKAGAAAAFGASQEAFRNVTQPFGY